MNTRIHPIDCRHIRPVERLIRYYCSNDDVRLSKTPVWCTTWLEGNCQFADKSRKKVIESREEFTLRPFSHCKNLQWAHSSVSVSFWKVHHVLCCPLSSVLFVSRLFSFYTSQRPSSCGILTLPLRLSGTSGTQQFSMKKLFVLIHNHTCEFTACCWDSKKFCSHPSALSIIFLSSNICLKKVFEVHSVCGTDYCGTVDRCDLSLNVITIHHHLTHECVFVSSLKRKKRLMSVV